MNANRVRILLIIVYITLIKAMVPNVVPELDPDVYPKVDSDVDTDVYTDAISDTDPEFEFDDEDEHSCSNTLFREKRSPGKPQPKKSGPKARKGGPKQKKNRSGKVNGTEAGEPAANTKRPRPPGITTKKPKKPDKDKGGNETVTGTPGWVITSGAPCKDKTCCSTKTTEGNRCIPLKDKNQCNTQAQGCNWCDQDEHECDTIYFHDKEFCQFNNIPGCCEVNQDEPVCIPKTSCDPSGKPICGGTGFCSKADTPRNLTVRFHGRGDKIMDLYFLFDFSVSTRMDDQRPKMAEYAEFLVKEYEAAGKDLRIGFGSFIDKEVVEARGARKKGAVVSSQKSGKRKGRSADEQASEAELLTGPKGRSTDGQPAGADSQGESMGRAAKPGKKTAKKAGAKPGARTSKTGGAKSGKRSKTDGADPAKPAGGGDPKPDGADPAKPAAGGDPKPDGADPAKPPGGEDPKQPNGEGGDPKLTPEEEKALAGGVVLKGHSFRNSFSLTTKFKSVLTVIKAYTKFKIPFGDDGTNRYTKESQLEAMSQIGLCPVLSWRPDATKIIVMMTDGGFHDADEDAEGQNVGGKLKPFDSKCNLDDSGSYRESLTMQYPKVNDVYKILNKAKVNTLIVFFKSSKTEAPGTWKDEYEKDKVQWEGYVKGSKNRATFFTWTKQENEGLKKAADEMHKLGMKEDSGSDGSSGYTLSLSNKGDKLDEVGFRFFSECDGGPAKQTDTCKVWPKNDVLEFIVQFTLRSCKGAKGRQEYNTLFHLTGVSYDSPLNYSKVCGSSTGAPAARKSKPAGKKKH